VFNKRTVCAHTLFYILVMFHFTNFFILHTSIIFSNLYLIISYKKKTYLVKLAEINLNFFFLRLSFTDSVIYKYRAPANFLPVPWLSIRLLPLSIGSCFNSSNFSFFLRIRSDFAVSRSCKFILIMYCKEMCSHFNNNTYIYIYNHLQTYIKYTVHQFIMPSVNSFVMKFKYS
jgi:hypothetical protein